MHYRYGASFYYEVDSRLVWSLSDQKSSDVCIHKEKAVTLEEYNTILIALNSFKETVAQLYSLGSDEYKKDCQDKINAALSALNKSSPER